MDSLVSTDWLAQHLGETDLVPVDCTWFMPSLGRDARAEYLQAHIPGARFLDIDEVADRTNPAPHMLPSARQFGEAMGKLGIGRDDRIVVYDNSPHRTAARGWFTFRHFGADKVAMLDGGFAKWLAEGRPRESGEPGPRSARFEAAENPDVVAKEQILAGLDLPLLDARGRARFEGTEGDPRSGVAPGHIPGSRNLPSAELYNADGTLKSGDELRRLFASAGIDPEQPFVATCGSGVTASSLIFAAHLLGNHENRLYDGSWSEWGADPATPKVLGPA
ncbi:MAG: sulfurtransferase [Sphingomonadales bacterium]|nr:sulfurtransferase [Sphingomonadales bacterium]